MPDSANVDSIDAIRLFAAAVAKFQEEARLCLTMIDSQLRQILFWLERDRPGFWKHEIENCMREVADARVRLHQCRMRKQGDFRPSCIEEVKDLEKSRSDVEFAQKQVPNVKRWYGEATHEGEEYRGRAAQLTQAIDRDLPRLMALLAFTIDRLEAYAAVSSPKGIPDSAFMKKISMELEEFLKSVPQNDDVDADPGNESKTALP
jgi:molecular chaperone GrpE (heat shock protein)